MKGITVTLAPFETTHVMTQSRVKEHRKRVNIITEPPDKNLTPNIVTNPGNQRLWWLNWQQPM